MIQHNRDGTRSQYTLRQTFGGSISPQGISAIGSALANALPFYDSSAQQIRNNVDRTLSNLVGRNVSVFNARGVSASPSQQHAGHGGTPGSNIAQNRAFRDAARAEGLDAREREILRREVEDLNRNRGENLGYHEIRELARSIKTGDF